MRPSVEWQAARVAADEAAALEKHERLMAKADAAEPSSYRSANARRKASKAAWEAKRKSDGLCVNCPNQSDGHAKCAACREKGRVACRIYHARKRGE